MSKFHFWLRAECKPNERRVILQPHHIQQLLKIGHKVTVERSINRCVADKAYENIKGVSMVAEASWPLAPKDAIILGLKELPPRPYLLTHHHVYFAHCYKNQQGWAEILQRFTLGKGTLWDLEFLRDENDKRAVAFGMAAGYAGMALGLLAWARQQRRIEPTWEAKPAKTYVELAQRVRQEVLKVTKNDVKLAPKVLVIAPRGRCGQGAIKCVIEMNIPGLQISSWDRKEIGTGGPYSQLLHYDILVNCIYLTDEIKTPFITQSMIRDINVKRKLTVISDVSCDPGSMHNPLPVYHHCTSFDEPVQRVFEHEKLPPLDVISIDHLPSLIPLESSCEFGDKLLPLLKQFADMSSTVWKVNRQWFEKTTKILQQRYHTSNEDTMILQRYHRLDLLRVKNPSLYYPHKFYTTHTPQSLHNTFGHLKNGSRELAHVHVSTMGRIDRCNVVGNKLAFYAIEWNGATIQLFWQQPDHWWFGELKRGDIVGTEGYPLRTKRGELSIYVQKLILLTPCVRALPYKGTQLTLETRYRQRYLHTLLDPINRNVFLSRSTLIQALRKFLMKNGFLEVETPTLNNIAGGANAKPFITLHNALNAPFFLRIAPELYLKELIVGGFPKVFEIGKNFRNEGMDGTHNPEYTACEFYWAGADYHDLMTFTERLLPVLVKSVTGGSLTITYQNQVIDFTPPYKIIHVLEGLKKCGVRMPTNLQNVAARRQLDAECRRLKIDCAMPRTTARLLDALIGELLEPQCINPTFIIDHPQIMSPLAKWHRNNAQVTERFEMFVMKKEIMNAYTELNDPRKQRELFAHQEKDRDEGDDEAQLTDENFCQALEYGLPPTAGWGLGIDRLLMFLTNCTSIKDVILFPTTRPLPQSMSKQVHIAFFGSGACSSQLISELMRSAETRLLLYTDQEKQAQSLIRSVVRTERQENVKIIPLLVKADVVKNQSLIEKLKTCELIISMLPPSCHVHIAELAILAKKTLLTPSYLNDSITKLHERAQKAEVMILTELGLDPGLDHILTMNEIASIRKEHQNKAHIHKIKTMCGVVPRLDISDHSPLRYKFLWNPTGLLRSLNRPAITIHNGIKHSHISPYNESKPMCIRGLTMDAVYNEDASRYIKNYFTEDEQKKATLERYTLRLYQSVPKFNQLRRHVNYFKDDESIVSLYEKNHGKNNPDFCAKLTPCKFSEEISNYVSKTQFMKSLGFYAHEPVIDARNLTALETTAQFLANKWCLKENERDMMVMQIMIHYSTIQKKKRIRKVSLIEFGHTGITTVSKYVGLCMATAAKCIIEGIINPKKYAGVQRSVHPLLAKAILDKMNVQKSLPSLRQEDIDDVTIDDVTYSS